MPPACRTILFDLDGTLIDSIELILSSYRHTMERHRGWVPPTEVWLAGLGTPLRAQFGKFSDDPAEIDAMVDTYRTYNLAHHDALVGAYPGIPEAVRRLRDDGKRLGIVTSKARALTNRGLRCAGLDGLFEAIVGSDDVERHKPDPTPVLRALDLLDADPAKTAFVGDSPHDIAAGHGAGVETAAVLWGPFTRDHLAPVAPDLWLETPADLVRHFAGNGKAVPGYASGSNRRSG